MNPFQSRLMHAVCSQLPQATMPRALLLMLTQGTSQALLKSWPCSGHSWELGCDHKNLSLAFTVMSTLRQDKGPWKQSRTSEAVSGRHTCAQQTFEYTKPTQSSQVTPRLWHYGSLSSQQATQSVICMGKAVFLQFHSGKVTKCQCLTWSLIKNMVGTASAVSGVFRD